MNSAISIVLWIAAVHAEVQTFYVDSTCTTANTNGAQTQTWTGSGLCKQVVKVESGTTTTFHRKIVCSGDVVNMNTWTSSSTCSGTPSSTADVTSLWPDPISTEGCYASDGGLWAKFDAALPIGSWAENCPTPAPAPAPAPVTVEMEAPSKDSSSVQNVTVSGAECVWVKWQTQGSFSTADENRYTTTMLLWKTASLAGERHAVLLWHNGCTRFAIGAPAAEGTGAPECTASKPAGSSYPFYASVTQSEEYCMAAGKIQYIGFYSNCSTPATAIVEVALKNFCSEDEQSTWKIVLWVVVAVVVIGIGVGIYFIWRCCCREEPMDKSQIQWVMQPNTTIQGVGIQPSNMVINMTNETEPGPKVEDFGIKDADEKRRLRAAAFMRSKEEREAQRQRQVAEDERSKMNDEMEAFDATIRKKKHDEKEREDSVNRRHEEAQQRNQLNVEETASILGEAQKEIAAIVAEAHTLPKDQCKAKLKQLRIRWHPDKNRMLKNLANDIMKIINDEIEKNKKK